MLSKQKENNIIICGLGGQGVVLTSDILSEYFLQQGYDLKVSDIMGLGQRGGSVMTHFRYGEKIHSPLIKKGTADLIISFEKTEMLRWLHFLKSTGTICCNDYLETPTTVTCDLQEQVDVEGYLEKVQQQYNLQLVQINQVITEHQLKRQVSNVIMLGYVTQLLGWDGEMIMNLLAQRIKKEYLKMNQLAFELGQGLLNK